MHIFSHPSGSLVHLVWPLPWIQMDTWLMSRAERLLFPSQISDWFNKHIDSRSSLQILPCILFLVLLACFRRKSIISRDRTNEILHHREILSQFTQTLLRDLFRPIRWRCGCRPDLWEGLRNYRGFLVGRNTLPHQKQGDISSNFQSCTSTTTTQSIKNLSNAFNSPGIIA